MTKPVILSMLKTKFPSLGLSEKSMADLADIVLATEGLTSETLESAVDGVAPFAKLMQKESQRQVQAALANRAKEDEDKDQGSDAGSGSGNDKKTTTENPELKTILDELKSLRGELSTIKQEKETTSRKSVYEKELEGLSDAVKASKINAFNRMTFKDDADFAEFVESEKTSVGELKTSLNSRQAGQFGSSFQAPSGANGNQKAAPADVKAVLKNLSL